MESIYCSSCESVRFFEPKNNGKLSIAAAVNRQGFLSRRTMEKIYCSSCELARIFELKEERRKLCLPMWIGKDSEPKNNGKDLLQQLGIGQCFWAEETKEKSWSCRCVSARILSRRTMERELSQQQWIGKDSEFEKQWRDASSSYHKIGKDFELKKQWSDVSKTFLSICKDLAQRSRRILEQISVTEMMILKKFAIMKRPI